MKKILNNNFLRTFAILFGINMVEFLLMNFGITLFSNKIVGLLIVNLISVLILKQMDIIK